MIFRLLQVRQYQFAQCKFTNYKLIVLWTTSSYNPNLT